MHGTNLNAAGGVKCDLLTFSAGPYKSDALEPGAYFLLYGFQNSLALNNRVYITIGGLRNGPFLSLPGTVRFSILQETPANYQPFVELFFKEVELFQTTNTATLASGPGTCSPSNAQVQVSAETTCSWTGQPADIAIFKFGEEFPALESGNGLCSSIMCVVLGGSTNWLVLVGSLASSMSIALPVGLIKNAQYAIATVIKVYSYSSLILVASNDLAVTYSRAPMATTFQKLASEVTLYSNVEQYHSVTFTPTTAVTSLGFIELAFTNIEVSPVPYCFSTTLLPNDLRGILCNVTSATSIRVYNFRDLANTAYTVVVRLAIRATSSVAVSVTATTFLSYLVASSESDSGTASHSSNTIIPSGGFISAAIPNPLLVTGPLPVSSVEPLELHAAPSSATLNSAATVEVTLQDHEWNGGFFSLASASNPLFCTVNAVRGDCSYSRAGGRTTFSISLLANMSLTASSNRLYISTEYLTDDGIVFPSKAGLYNLVVKFLDSSSTLLCERSTPYTVVGKPFKYLHVMGANSDTSSYNMFTFEFELFSGDYLDFSEVFNGATYSRIFVDFPTVDKNGDPVFAQGMGLTDNKVGCSVYQLSGYVVGLTANPITCRYLPHERTNGNNVVEIYNHIQFTGATRKMLIKMAGMRNPASALTSITFTMRMNRVTRSTNQEEELYRDSFELFADLKAAVSSASEAWSNAYLTPVFRSNFDVQDTQGYFSLRPYAPGRSASDKFYFVLPMPSNLQVYAEEQIGSVALSSASCDWVDTFPEINWAIAFCLNNNPVVRVYYVVGPTGIPAGATTINAQTWLSEGQLGRYLSEVVYTVSASYWNELVDTITSVSGGFVHSATEQRTKNHQKVYVYVDFTLSKMVPASGTIEIAFSGGVTTHSHCRSATTLQYPGTLQSGLGLNIGRIGCKSLGANWIITGFSTITADKRVRVVGMVDLPGTNGVLAGTIKAFANQDADIGTNGQLIMSYSGSLGVTVSNDAAVALEAEYSQHLQSPVRAGAVGPLYLRLNLPGGLSGPNAGRVKLRLPRASAAGQAGGFSVNLNDKLACQLQTTAGDHLGCILISTYLDSSPGHQHYTFVFVTSAALAAEVDYRFWLTSHSGTFTSEGVIMPTASGTYRLDLLVDPTGSGTFSVHNQLYIDCYGAPFASLEVKSTSTKLGTYNILLFSVTPSTAIAKQLVIEVPVVSLDNNTLFAPDLGLGLSNYEDIPFDVYDSGTKNNNFMKCRFMQGDVTLHQNARIVCSDFASSLLPSDTLRFAIRIKNPTSISTTSASIPLFIYSFNPSTGSKDNYATYENAIQLGTI